LRASAPAAPEEVGEDVAEAAEVAEIKLLETDTARPCSPHLRATGAEHVVLLALVGVGEDVVGVLDLLKALLGFLVAGIGVGVVAPCQLAVGLLDLLRGGGARNPKRLVEVARHWSLLLLSARDNHARRAQDPIAEQIAALYDLEDRPLFGPGGNRRQRLVHVRIEGDIGGNLLQPLFGQHITELAMDETNAVLELGLFV
jgi:hypothetical protein